jgi:predicted SprT family Zn-dependent metalloprotease
MTISNAATNLLGALLPEWHLLLQEWSASGRLTAAALEALLLDGEPQALQDLVNQWSTRNFQSIPEIVLVSNADINGAMGAYAQSTGKIYLNADWFATASQESVNAVLTEELGHHLDGLLNKVDTSGDEGEYFSDLLRGVALTTAQKTTIRAESDMGTTIVGDLELQVEFAGLIYNISQLDPSIAIGGSYDLVNGDQLTTPYGSNDLTIRMAGGGNIVSLGISNDPNGNGFGRGNTSLFILSLDAGGNSITINGDHGSIGGLPSYVIPAWYSYADRCAIKASNIQLGNGSNIIDLSSNGIVVDGSTIVIGDGSNRITISSGQTAYSFGDQAILLKDSNVRLGSGDDRIDLAATASTYGGSGFTTTGLLNSFLNVGSGNNTLHLTPAGGFDLEIAKNSNIVFGLGNDDLVISGRPYQGFNPTSSGSSLIMGEGMDRIIVRTNFNNPWGVQDQEYLNLFIRKIGEETRLGSLFGFDLRYSGIEELLLQGLYYDYIADSSSPSGFTFTQRTATYYQLDLKQLISALDFGPGVAGGITSQGNVDFVEGVTLLAGSISGDPDGNGSITAYQWYLNNAAISGATAATYTTSAIGFGNYRVDISYLDGKGYAATVASADQAVSKINNGNGTAGAITAQGNAAFSEGVTLVAAAVTGDPDGAAAITAYQWYLNNATINGAISASYTTSATGFGNYRVDITYIDGQAFAATVASADQAVSKVDNGDAVFSITGTRGAVTFRKDVTPGLPLRRPASTLTPGPVRSLPVAC